MRYSYLPLTNIISFCLSQNKEGDFWDFKQEWHSNIEDLIKDIICFANTVHNEDCYLMFGIADDHSLVGMKNARRKQADILDTISKLSFAGDILPEISVTTVDYEGVELDVLIIHNTDNTPIYLKRQYGKMRQGCIYARVGDRNTPDEGNAEIAVIEQLWKKRFGLTKTHLEYIFDALRNKQDWSTNNDGYYHIYKPEYTIEHVYEDDSFSEKDSDEFYSFSQSNPNTSYFMLDIKARGTTLESHQIVCLDSGRLTIPVPEWGYIDAEPYSYETIRYKYYIEGSHTELLLHFMYLPEDSEQRWAFRNFEKVVLFFASETEKRLFEKYVCTNIPRLNKRVEESEAYNYVETGNEVKTADYKKCLRTAIALNAMLREFREYTNQKAIVD